METRHAGLTRLEILLIIVAILLLVAVVVPQLAVVWPHHRSHVSRVIITQLEFGVEEYRRVYGVYPHDTVWWNPAAGALEGLGPGYAPCEYRRAQGYESLYLALQGPTGSGWGPTAAAPGVRLFGPIPESPGFVGHDPTTGRPHFECPFGRPILYYKARTAGPPTISSAFAPGDGRHAYEVCHKAWENADRQRGVDEPAGAPYVFQPSSPSAKEHWVTRLTRVVGPAGERHPYNPGSYALWAAGFDERFGYWEWNSSLGGLVADPDPSDPADGRIGVCDDPTNF